MFSISWLNFVATVILFQLVKIETRRSMGDTDYHNASSMADVFRRFWSVKAHMAGCETSGKSRRDVQIPHIFTSYYRSKTFRVANLNSVFQFFLMIIQFYLYQKPHKYELRTYFCFWVQREERIVSFWFQSTMSNKAVKIFLYTHWLLISQPEWNQNEYSSITGPFPLKSRREWKLANKLLRKHRFKTIFRVI